MIREAGGRWFEAGGRWFCFTPKRLMKRLKTFMVISLVLLMIFLAGCTEIEISAGIDADLTAYLSYHIVIDVEEVDSRYHNTIKRALNEIGWYYQEEYNFVVQLNIETNPYSVNMSRRMQNSSLEQAYQSLKFLLTNEDITPLMTLDMAFQTSERQSKYILSATTDIPYIISLSNVEELSPAMLQQFKEAIETGEGNITLTLPTTEVYDSSHNVNVQNNQAIMVVPLSFTDRTDFELTGTINFLRDGTPGGSLNEIVQEQYRLRSFAVLACIAALGLFVITILIIILKRKRA